MQFPHFHRIIAAPTFKEYILFFLWLCFLSFILLNTFSFYLSEADTGKKLAFLLLRSPHDKDLHEKLGKHILSFNVERAKQEYLLAQELYSMKGAVLGQQDPPEEKWKQIETEKATYEKQVQLWENAYQMFPDYTYAWVKLAVLYHQLDNDAQSQKYIQKLQAESPYKRTITDLIGKLNRNLLM